LILLDTYTLIGIASEPARLSPTAKKLIENPANPLFVSAISALEIGIAVQKHRLRLELPPREWFAQVLAVHGIEPLDVTWEIAAASFELPPHHADPSDRIIIATAAARELILLTPDQHIHKYSEARVAW
jgi:PIN domain nuclease of toxin-antitoxin system